MDDQNNNTPDSEVIQSALEYARHGLPVIALYGPGEKCKAPGKQPREEDWPNKGTTEKAAVADLFRRYPRINFGVLTGRKSDLVIVDIDGPAGRASWEKLVAEHGRPDTVCVLTGGVDGGGNRNTQYYFRYPADAEIKSSSNVLRHLGLPGIDIRGDGGQAVGVGSIHVSGLRYEFEFLCGLGEVAIAEMPPWLIKLLCQPKRAKEEPRDELASISDGCRNSTLTQIAGSLRRQGLDADEMFDVLLKINDRRCQPPLDESEVQTIARSVARYPVDIVVAALDFSEDPDDWPDPLPIDERPLAPVTILKPESIPASFRPWLADVARRMQAPLDFVAAGAIVAASAVVGAGCSIRPKKNDDWTVIPNLWGCIIGRPSMLKTPSLAEIMKPLGRMEAEAKADYDDKLAFYLADAESFKAQREAIRSKMVKAAKDGRDMTMLQTEYAGLEAAPEPIRRRFKTNDSTVEKLGELLNDNPRGFLVFRDELTGLLASFEREDRQSDRAFYLEAWNGSQGFTTDRIGRGTLDVKNCCLSILGGIQPSKLAEYLLRNAEGLRNDGMLQRFQLMVFPDEPKDWKLIDEAPDTDARDKAFKVFKTLADMNFVEAGANIGERPYFHFDDAGQWVFYEWLTGLERAIRGEDSSLMCEHLAKYRSLMPSLALLFHLVEIAAGGRPGPIWQGSAEMAAAWCTYLESHARRVYGIMAGREAKAAAALAEKITSGKVQNGFSARDIYRNHWTLLDSPESVEQACRELEELNWLRRGKVDIVNRHPKVVFYINPKISPQKPE